MAIRKLIDLQNKLREHSPARTAVALTAAAAILVGGLFNAPADVLHEDRTTGPTEIVQLVDTDPGDDGDGEEEPGTQEEKRGIRAKLRQLLLRMPLILRFILLLPLWLIGTALHFALSAIFKAFLGPLLRKVFLWLLLTVLAFILILAVIKLLFPDISLKELLTKRNLLLISAASALLGTAGTVLSIVWPDKKWLPPLIDLIGATLVFLIILVKAKLHMRKTAAAK